MHPPALRLRLLAAGLALAAFAASTAGCRCAAPADAQPAAAPRETRLEIPSGGNTLAAVLTTPAGCRDGGKVPLVVIMHGITVHKDWPLYKAISDRLAAEGYATLRFDFDGHGESTGADFEMTVPKEIGDARAVFDCALSLGVASRIAFLGHSQGGLVAGMAAAELGADKVPVLVQMAPAAAAKDLRSDGMFAGRRLFDPADLPDRVALPSGYTVGRGYLETAAALPVYETAATYAGDVLLLQGGADIVVPPAYADRYAEAYKAAARCEYALIPGENHNFSEDQDAAIDRILAFLDSHLK